MDRAIYDRMAEIDAEHWWFSARRLIVATAIERMVALPANPRILEVGCGTGSNLAMLGRFGRVDAIEPDPAARALAHRRSGYTVSGGSLPDGEGIADGRYDLITLLDVLEHVEDDRGSLAMLTAKLAPGGKLLVTVPALPWLWSAHDEAHHHKRRYTESSLRAAITDGGFRLRALAHFNSLLFPAIAAARLWGRVSGRPGSDEIMPARLLNAMLAALFGAERYWLGRWSPPFGVSLLAVAEPIGSGSTGAWITR